MSSEASDCSCLLARSLFQSTDLASAREDSISGLVAEVRSSNSGNEQATKALSQSVCLHSQRFFMHLLGK
ncbi:hypothetical protein HAX54_003562 [Datura stramonium]|uniref:Uncharacterized protein n=1 Tax=Datura stramonium TaxID=4076 RepID=A0ABS8T717_DATST|nr:hypothetical protein [Datura stramonium]